nr:unnamed protein product [Callosobruchus chinensis]
MAKFHKLKIPQAWEDRKMAGIDWLYGFRKRHPEIRLRVPPGTIGLAQPTDWMTGELFANVMRHFIQMTSSTKDNPTIIIMDNHESHLAPAVLNIAKDNGVDSSHNTSAYN